MRLSRAFSLRRCLASMLAPSGTPSSPAVLSYDPWVSLTASLPQSPPSHFTHPLSPSFCFRKRHAEGLPQNLTVVGATSGDTGSSAIYGLRGKRGIDVRRKIEREGRCAFKGRDKIRPGRRFSSAVAVGAMLGRMGMGEGGGKLGMHGRWGVCSI